MGLDLAFLDAEGVYEAGSEIDSAQLKETVIVGRRC